jgi:hypothetical protein
MDTLRTHESTSACYGVRAAVLERFAGLSSRCRGVDLITHPWATLREIGGRIAWAQSELRVSLASCAGIRCRYA